MLILDILVFLGFCIIAVSAVHAPTKPLNLRVHLLSEYSPIVELTWEAPYESFGRIKNYRIFWGQQNGVTRYETIPGYALRWTSDYLYDGVSYVFELRAENDVAIGAATFASISTGTMDRVYPPNRRSRMFGNSQGSNTLRLSWDEPTVAVSGYRIFYKPLTEMYTGRWRKLDIPPSLSIDIRVDEPLSTVYGYHVIANTTTNGDSTAVRFNRNESSRRSTGRTSNRAIGPLTDFMLVYLNKAPQLWALQAGINAMAPAFQGK